MLSRESRRESPEKELKIRFYMKAPTLILKENSRAVTTTEHREPKVNYLLLWSTTNVYTVYN